MPLPLLPMSFEFPYLLSVHQIASHSSLRDLPTWGSTPFLFLLLRKLFFSSFLRWEGDLSYEWMSGRAYAFSSRERQDVQSRLRMSTVVAHPSRNGGKSSVTEQTHHGIA